MLGAMHVTRLGAGDVERAANARPSFTADAVAYFFECPDNLLLVAAPEEGAPDVAYLVAYIMDRLDEGRMICLYDVEVQEEHRRRGAARALIEELKAFAARENVAKIWAVTDKANAAAAALYESTGASRSGDGDDVVFVYG